LEFAHCACRMPVGVVVASIIPYRRGMSTRPPGDRGAVFPLRTRPLRAASYPQRVNPQMGQQTQPSP